MNPQRRRRDRTTDSFAEVSVLTTMVMGSYGRSGRVPAALVTRAMAAKVSAVAASMACLPGLRQHRPAPVIAPRDGDQMRHQHVALEGLMTAVNRPGEPMGDSC